MGVAPFAFPCPKTVFYFNLLTMPQAQLYTQYIIEIPNEAYSELLVALLSEMGMDGFEQQETILIASGLSDAVDIPAIDALLHQHDLLYETKQIQNENWNAIWESSFEPVLVEDFAGIRAGFHAPLLQVKHEIVITPKMSFGTGHHATTWLMIERMRHLDFVDKGVLDFGTGTGVLAILAAKLGAQSVHAIDNDDWSIENAKENVANNSAVSIALYLNDSLPAHEQFDIILANINKHVILAHAVAMYHAVKPGGYWLLSGLLQSDEADICEIAQQLGLAYVATSYREGWISLQFVKPLQGC